MFLSILIGLFIICGIMLFMIFDIDREPGEIALSLIALIIGIIGIIILAGVPYKNIYDNPEYIEELYIAKIEVLDNLNEDNITIENITAIKEYNEKVNVNNNLFVKWKKQDRSEFELGYDYYYNLYLEQRGYKPKSK